MNETSLHPLRIQPAEIILLSTARTKTAILHETELFRGLPEHLLNQIAQYAVSKRLERDQVLYSEEEQAVAVYVICEGELRSLRQTEDGRQQILSTETRNAVLAAAAIFNRGTYYSTIVAATHSEVLCLPAPYFRQFCQQHPELLWNLGQVLARRVRQYAELIESLALRNVNQRTAEHLLSMAGPEAHDGCLVELTMTRTDMAARIGSAREAISRALTQLQDMLLIHIEGPRSIRIPDVRALREFARTNDNAHARLGVPDLSSQIA